MQSSNLEAAKAVQAAYVTEHERDAFAAGYGHAHGIACHNIPVIGQGYWTDEGRITAKTAEEARELHAILCYDAERNARYYSPWECTAHEINSLPESDRDSAWKAYEHGVSMAITHDLMTYTDADYMQD
jgi:hypothetical protein